jgi:hypothetical protein
VFTDESYVHCTHCGTCSYFRKNDAEMQRARSKGERLIIIHAITPDGPLAERDINDDNIPVSNLVWVGDTPNPTPRPDGKISCETIWRATLRTGDFHDNMNSEMFMLWVEDKVMPSFERIYPGNTMILVCDNAPYHHKRIVGSMSSKSKKELVQLCVEYNVRYIDVPWNDRRLTAYQHEDFWSVRWKV